MRNRLLLFASLLMLQPAVSKAGCTDADLSRAASQGPTAWVAQCRRCGGYVTKGANNRCEGYAKSSGSSAGSAPDLSGVSSAISNAMREREEEIKRQNLEAMQNLDAQNRNRLSAEQQQVEQANAEKHSSEEQRRQAALSRMDTAPSDSGIAPMDFKDYRQRQAERAPLRENKPERKLSKAEQAWCKLHVPLKPTESIHKVEGQDDNRMALYEMKKTEWDRRCLVRQEAALEKPR